MIPNRYRSYRYQTEQRKEEHCEKACISIPHGSLDISIPFLFTHHIRSSYFYSFLCILCSIFCTIPEADGFQSFYFVSALLVWTKGREFCYKAVVQSYVPRSAEKVIKAPPPQIKRKRPFMFTYKPCVSTFTIMKQGLFILCVIVTLLTYTIV